MVSEFVMFEVSDGLFMRTFVVLVLGWCFLLLKIGCRWIAILRSVFMLNSTTNLVV